METNQFILALSKTLPESCLQGLAVYLILQLLFYIDKRSTPSLKFNLYYTANLCLFAGFVLTFFHHYQQSQINAFYPKLLPDKIGNNIVTETSKPNLWLQFSFWTSRYAYLITCFYLIGLHFCMLKLTIGLININWFRNNKNLKLDNYLSNISNQLSSNFRLIKTVSVYLSDKICVPLTLGFIKPIIVFPIALINQLSAEQTEAILLHELAHIKRNDYLLNLLLGIVRSFLFFNPVVWLMEREINKYREQCCDDLVLDNTQHKIAYAHALLLIEESRNAQLTLTLASNGEKYTLLNRIKRITNMKINEPSPQNKLVLLLLAFIVIGISVAWNMPVKKTLKHLTVHNFKVIKEVSDSTHVEQFSNKTIDYPVHKSAKKSKPANRKFTVNSFTDTVIKSKNRFKIVLEDSTGNKKEYNSAEELPADAQKEFLKQNGNLNGLMELKDFPKMNMNFHFADSNQFASIKKLSANPQWKKQAEEMRKLGEQMRLQFNNPQFKKQMENFRLQGEKMRLYYNSSEWKKQQEEMRKQGEALRKQFDSPQWKKQIEESTKKSIDSARKNWKNSNDYQPKQIVVPQKQLEPEKL